MMFLLISSVSSLALWCRLVVVLAVVLALALTAALAVPLFAAPTVTLAVTLTMPRPLRATAVCRSGWPSCCPRASAGFPWRQALMILTTALAVVLSAELTAAARCA